jgi:hypothetical protein
MTQRRSWAGTNLEIPDNIYRRVRKRLCTMEKDVPVKTSEDILISGKLNLFILGPKGTVKTVSCDYI